MQAHMVTSGLCINDGRGSEIALITPLSPYPATTSASASRSMPLYMVFALHAALDLWLFTMWRLCFLPAARH